MSVDKIRETHHINRVAPSDLGLLMSAQSYRPEITQAVRKIKSFPWAPLQSLVKNIISPGPHPVYGGNYPCLKTKNVSELLADLEPADFADVKGIGNLERVQVERGDLLINLTGAGSIGRVSIYYGDDLPITNQHIARMGIKDTYDEGYVAAFLRTWWGERALEQGVAGSTGQINMVNDHVRSIPVIILNPAAQKYIGDKVRQAERLRVLSQKLEQYANNSFQEDFQWDGTVLSVKSFNRLRVDELENRLDLKYNSPQRLAAIRHAKKVNAKLQPLDALVDISAMIGWKGLTTENYTKTGPWLLRGVEFGSGVIRTEDLVCVEEHKYLEQPQIHLKEGDIALTKDGTIGKAIVIPRLPNRIAAGSTVARLRKKTTSGVDAYYLEFALAHEFVQCQISSFATGVAQPHITQEWIALLNIPRIKSEDKIALAWQQHHISLNFAKQLTNAAKLLVEALIEGQLTENELIAAEQALQTGNDQLDRRVLNRLKVDGIDGQGQALFDDLDELYHLLTQAEGDG